MIAVPQLEAQGCCRAAGWSSCEILLITTINETSHPYESKSFACNCKIEKKNCHQVWEEEFWTKSEKYQDNNVNFNNFQNMLVNIKVLRMIKVIWNFKRICINFLRLITKTPMVLFKTTPCSFHYVISLL